MIVRHAALWLRRRFVTPAGGASIETLIDPGFVAIDVETTGLDPRRDAVVSLAAIPFVGGEPQAGYSRLVDPHRPIPESSTRIHGIDDALVTGAPSLEEVLPAFDAVCAGAVVVGHDVAFDVTVLKRARRRHQWPEPHRTALDTRRLSVALYPSWRHRAELETVAAALGIPVIGRHTADGDARLAGKILLALLPEFRTRGARTLSDLTWAQTSVFRRA